MRFTESSLPGCYLIDIEKLADERGFFARAWCNDEFNQAGLSFRVCQANLSFNKIRGTIRGLHYQKKPFCEAKLIRCNCGAIYDVAVDLRPGSPTYLQWTGVELSSANHRMLYVPETFAHGFQTLQDNTEVFYLVSEFYTPRSEGGIRYNDRKIGVKWPTEVSAISDKDANWPDFER